MNNPLLELKHVTKEFHIGGGFGIRAKKTIKAVDNVSFKIHGEEPTITALVGENGSGKSTIAKMIMGLLEPTSGKILYDGKDIKVWLKKDKKNYRRNVQMIFQDPYSIYNPFYRVERILFVTIKKFGLASTKAEAHKMVIESMQALGLRPKDIMGRYPHQLSGGERQRLMLVRILLLKPKLAIADEPVSMIDASLRSIFLNNLRDLKDQINMSCLYITHDLNIAHYICNDMIVLCHGKIVEMGKTTNIIEDPMHPYTANLISSIPIPDPKERWKNVANVEHVAFEEILAKKGCIYSHRCPRVMPICTKHVPPLIEVEPGRKVACFIYPEVREAVKSG